MRGHGARQFLCDRLFYALEILQNLMVPEADNAEALRHKPALAGGVMTGPYGVLSTVDLDDQAM